MGDQLHAGATPKDSKEWKLIEKMMASLTREQSLTRRWGIFFKLLTFAYLFFLLWFVGNSGIERPAMEKEHTAMVQVKGMIGEGFDIDANTLVAGLRAAFEAKHAKGVLLSINSPGGTPVQSAMVYNEIMRLREKHADKKVIAAITDTGASGAYYIASAAHEIYSNQSSIIGSIGVVSTGFGFSETLTKLGVERRVFSAGTNKAMLDPFLPAKADEETHFENVLGIVHRQFIDDVKAGREEKLVDDASIFSGLFWTGEQALALGLVDGLASPGGVARDIFEAEKIVDYTPSKHPLDSLVKGLGVSIGDRITSWLNHAGSSMSLR